MYCPRCGTEYRSGFTRCADCDVALVAEKPPTSRTSDIRLVKVFETGNPALIPFVESLLEESKIEFITRNEGLQDLFGGGRIGTGFNTVIGPVQFWVREEDTAKARELLDEIDETSVEPPE